jgi:hypothetical protein
MTRRQALDTFAPEGCIVLWLEGVRSDDIDVVRHKCIAGVSNLCFDYSWDIPQLASRL